MMQQFLEHNVIQRAPYPAYSPDFELSDFCLFGYSKQLLAGREFSDAQAFMGRMNPILARIEKAHWKEHFSSEFRDFVDVLKSIESTSTKRSLHVKNFL
jgi:hypothetical protein